MKIEKAIVARRGVERRPALAPIREELVERPRLKDGAREDMGADLGALLDDANPELAPRRRGELLQTDRRRKTGRPGPDHDDVILHPLALDFRHRPTSAAPPSGL